MISIEDVKNIHSILIEQFGGSPGIRDEAALASAIARPYSTFDGIELYPSIEEKASAIIESIVINHPFIDGNKRIGYVLMRLFLLNAQMDIQATEEEKYQFVIRIASGKLHKDEILYWIRDHLTR